MWLTFFHIMETLVIILDSSMVEHSAVNRVVVGSSPTRGGRALNEHKLIERSESLVRTFATKLNESEPHGEA